MGEGGLTAVCVGGGGEGGGEEQEHQRKCWIWRDLVQFGGTLSNHIQQLAGPAKGDGAWQALEREGGPLSTSYRVCRHVVKLKPSLCAVAAAVTLGSLAATHWNLMHADCCTAMRRAVHVLKSVIRQQTHPLLWDT